MQKKVPSKISIGVGCYSSKRFDDKLKMMNGNFKIDGFKIYLQNDKICGIGIIYQNQTNGRKIIFTDTSQNQKCTSLYEFNIPTNDYIQVIFGHFDDTQITQLGIITYNGKQEIFGVDKGIKFNYMFMGYTFSGCSGIFKQGSIEALSFVVQKLPKEYIFNNLHPLLDIVYPNQLEENTKNTAYSEQYPINFSEFSEVENAAEIIIYEPKDEDQKSNIKKIEKGFEFQQAYIDLRPQQQQQQYISYGPNYVPPIQRGEEKKRINKFKLAIFIGEVIFWFIGHR